MVIVPSVPPVGYTWFEMVEEVITGTREEIGKQLLERGVSSKAVDDFLKEEDPADYLSNCTEVDVKRLSD